MRERSVVFKVEQWIGNVTQYAVGIAGFLTLAMGCLSTYGSLRRYVFRNPEPISFELNCMFLLLSFVLAIAAVEREDKFLRFELLLRSLPENVQNVISNIVSPVLGLTFFGIIIWISSEDAWRALEIGQRSQSAWPIPLFPVKIFIPVGYGILCVNLGMRLKRGINSMRK
ncbi:MAG: TRAP transporter small permease [candidate division WOR-3 bacterium]